MQPAWVEAPEKPKIDANFEHKVGSFVSEHAPSRFTVRSTAPYAYGSAGKRIVDVFVVVVAAPAALLIVAILGLAIAMTYGRPVFFTQERVGQHGRRFKMFKLRTMNNVTNLDAAVTAQVGDARVTPLGRVLRQYRLDELPQLLNILVGDMSLVGPRPEQPALVDKYRALISNFDERHLVKPGITGLAQIRCGYAGNLKETRAKVRYDRVYVRNCSLKLDALIALRTIGTILRNEGAR